MINNIKNKTISEAIAKKKINELNKTKKVETKCKRLIDSWKPLLGLFDDLVEAISYNSNNSNNNNNKKNNNNNNNESNTKMLMKMNVKMKVKMKVKVKMKMKRMNITMKLGN